MPETGKPVRDHSRVQEGMMVSGTGSGDGGESVQIKERVQ